MAPPALMLLPPEAAVAPTKASVPCAGAVDCVQVRVWPVSLSLICSKLLRSIVPPFCGRSRLVVRPANTGAVLAATGPFARTFRTSRLSIPTKTIPLSLFCVMTKLVMPAKLWLSEKSSVLSSVWLPEISSSTGLTAPVTATPLRKPVTVNQTLVCAGRPRSMDMATSKLRRSNSSAPLAATENDCKGAPLQSGWE